MADERTPDPGGDMSKPRVKRRDANRLLAALPAAEYKRLAPKLEAAPFRRGQTLQELDKPITHVMIKGDRSIARLPASAEDAFHLYRHGKSRAR